MQKIFAFGLTMLLLLAAIPLLSACNTTAGAGRDISAAGNAIDNAAQKEKP